MEDLWAAAELALYSAQGASARAQRAVSVAGQALGAVGRLAPSARSQRTMRITSFGAMRRRARIGTGWKCPRSPRAPLEGLARGSAWLAMKEEWGNGIFEADMDKAVNTAEERT